VRSHFKHVLMCVGPRCTHDGVASEALFQRLGVLLDARPQLKVKRTRTRCFSACKIEMPVLVVYPEGVWYHCPDEQTLERIVVDHLEGGCEVQEFIFHRLGEGDVCPSGGDPEGLPS
jgi:(2Fe-2S) ferredoxin